MIIGDMEIHPLQNSLMRFDGGSCFGHVPKVVWNRFVEADEINRVLVGCNTLLVRFNGLNILTDVGMGEKWTEKEIGLYGLETKSWDGLLAPFGLAPEDIDIVLLSHLHIDHAGAMTRWDKDGNVVLTFPNATAYVQRGEWEAANNPDLRSRPSYRPHDFVPLMEAGKLELLDGDKKLFDGCELVVTGGHTRWHQVIIFAAGKEEVVYTSDILPTALHLKPHWVMGYDLFPLGVMEARTQLLPRLSEPNVLIAFGHDPKNLLGHIRENEDGKHTFEPIDGGAA